MHVRTSLAVLVLALAPALTACGSQSSGNAPASHTVNMDGVMHHPGLQDPMNNCTACHGADLRGGEGPSCYSCHGQVW